MTDKEIREIVLKIIEWGNQLAENTENTIDDQVAKVAKALIENDVLWGLFVRFILNKLRDGDDEPILVGDDGELSAASDEVGIDPVLIYQLITAVIALWKLFRKDK